MASEKPRLALIAAVARHGVIGDGNRLLWHLPEDARHFRAQTLGRPVIMGRRTWESLPARFRPLPERTNIVITRQPGWAAPGAVVAHNLDDALAAAAAALPTDAMAATPRVFVIGGAELYAAALPRADELVLTEIDADFAGNTHFPAWPQGDFVETQRERHRAAAPNEFDFAFVTYRRHAPGLHAHAVGV